MEANRTHITQVCIIEDDETIRSSYAYLIGQEEGFVIAGQYASIEEAEWLLVADQPDIILLDVMLPGISGVDAIPRLRRSVPRAKIIILTVYESEATIFTALRNGAAGYLTKNIPSHRIIESIKEVMQGGGAMSTNIAKLVMQTFEKNLNSPLTKRETEVLEGIANGKSRGKIANQLYIDLETVKSHIKNIYFKLDVNSKDEAIKVARKERFI